MATEPAVRVQGLCKTFPTRAGPFCALDGVALRIDAGEMVALIGASGSGKSTLLRHLAGLIRSDANGSVVRVAGRVVQSNGKLHGDICATRASIGFIFQQFNLVDRLPVLTNVLAGLLPRVPIWRSMIRHFTAEEQRLGLAALDRVGIASHAYKRASQLSGGQQQRAAIARTLVQKAKVILADEPIASLDPESARRVMQILASINHEDGTTVVVSLHQVDMAIRYCPRVVALHQGKVVYDGPAKELAPAMLRELYGVDAEELLSSSTGTQDAMHPLPVPRATATPAVGLHQIPAIAQVASIGH
jgi:phosphonate transport system ATP-binding protein